MRERLTAASEDFHFSSEPGQRAGLFHLRRTIMTIRNQPQRLGGPCNEHSRLHQRQFPVIAA
ncbi:hypothetical protein, partial [Bradyrhizobium sp.]|uniref:hypothetical protein n=1 Tax=Bradyrhizobium sp. TaxID=376 RepID=UPI002908A243